MKIFQREQRSLFGEILDWMLTPLLLLWPISLALTWLVAQGIAGRPFDRGLEYNVQVLAQLVGTAEGVNTARVLRQLVEREGIATPISREVCRLLDGEVTPAGAIARLMERELTVEMPVAQHG